MIIEFKEDKINDIASAQMRAWQEAFKGILSEELLSNLAAEDFADNWKGILTQQQRKNYIWLNEAGQGVGFVSYGKPKSDTETADFEIYGIYVHPEYWGAGVGYELMKFAVESLAKLSLSARIVLWTMKENKQSKHFYQRFGYRENGKSRMSKRNNEVFEEIQFIVETGSQ